MPSLSPQIHDTEPALGLLEHWYVLSLAGRVTGEPLTTRFCGREVSLWREGNQLFSTPDGVFTSEQDGYVWGWHGHGAPQGPPPALLARRRPNLSWYGGSLTFPAGFVDSVENTLDLAHPIFAHPYAHPTWWLHRMGIRPVFRVRVSPDADGWFGEGFLGNRRVVEHAFRLPDQAYLAMFPGTAWENYTYAFHVPLTETSCRFEFLFGRRKLPWEQATTHDRGEGWPLHQQDRRILAGQLANRLRYPGTAEQHCAVDAYTLFFRRVIQHVQRGTWDEAWPQIAPFDVNIRL